MSRERGLYTGGIGCTRDKLPYRYIGTWSCSDCVFSLSMQLVVQSSHFATLYICSGGLSVRSSFVCLTQDECDPVVSSCFAVFPPGTDCFFIRYMNVLHDTIIKSRFNVFCVYILQDLTESPGYSCVILSFHVWLVARKSKRDARTYIHIYINTVCVHVCVYHIVATNATSLYCHVRP